MSVSGNAPAGSESIIELTELVARGPQSPEDAAASGVASFSGETAGAAPLSPDVFAGAATEPPRVSAQEAGAGRAEAVAPPSAESERDWGDLRARLSALEMGTLGEEALALRVRELERRMRDVPMASPVAESAWEARMTALESRVRCLEERDARLTRMEQEFSAMASRLEASVATVAARVIREEITALLSSRDGDASV